MKDWAVKKRGNLMSEKTKGILCIIFSALSFAFMSLFIKLSGDIPTLQKSFFRNFVAAVVAYAMLKKNHTPLKCSKESFKYVFGRAFFGTVGIFCNFYGVDHLNIADASMLNKLSPFFAIVFSYFILKERVEHYQVRCLISAIIGAMFILKPSGDAMLSIPALIAMIGGMGAGMAYTLLRKATGMGVKGPFIVFFFSVFSCICSLPYCILNYTHMEPIQWFYLFMTGVAATFGQFFITAAYSHAPAKELSVYDYSNVIFAGILGFIILGEIQDVFSYIGCVLIIAPAVIMFIIGNKKEKQEV